MPWPDDLIALAAWALQQEDLRHRFLRAKDAASIATTSGLDAAFETAAVLRIYEAALSKGYQEGVTVKYERPYRSNDPGNGERSDLAFKEHGVGQNWGLVEVKYYHATYVQTDIAKLLRLEHRVQRWMLVYRVVEDREHSGRGAPIQELAELMDRYAHWIDVKTKSFATIAINGKLGRCDVFLGRIGAAK